MGPCIPPFSGLVAVLSLRLNVQAGLTFGGVVPVDTVHWSGLETPITELHAVGRTRVFGCFDLVETKFHVDNF